MQLPPPPPTSKGEGRGDRSVADRPPSHPRFGGPGAGPNRQEGERRAWGEGEPAEACPYPPTPCHPLPPAGQAPTLTEEGPCPTGGAGYRAFILGSGFPGGKRWRAEAACAFPRFPPYSQPWTRTPWLHAARSEVTPCNGGGVAGRQKAGFTQGMYPRGSIQDGLPPHCSPASPLDKEWPRPLTEEGLLGPP